MGRRDNFSWLTCGGHNCVPKTSEMGVSYLVITPNQKYLIANTMDGRRIHDGDQPGDYQTADEKRWEASRCS